MSADARDFGRLEFAGGRFEGTGMPVSALLELRRLEVLIEEVAVALYRREHPRRERAARGFRASFDLRVSEFQEGCVEALLTRPASDSTRLDIAASDYFERSRDLVYSEIEYFGANGEFSPQFPTDAQSRLAILGRGLQDNESVGLRGPSQEGWATLDADLRALLSEAVADAPPLKDVVIIGQITGLDSRPHQVSVFVAEEQRTVKGTFDSPETWNKLHSFTGYQGRAELVALSALVRVAQTGELESIEEIFAVEPAVPLRLAEQISKLSELEDGWYDGAGERVSKVVVDRVERLAEVLGTSKHPNVSIFPRVDGGAQFEWLDEEYEIDVLPDGNSSAYAFAEERDDDGERHFNLSDSPQRIVSWLYGEEDV